MDKRDRSLNILVQVHNSYVDKNLVIKRNETIDKYLDLRILQPLQYRKEAIELFVNLFFTKIDDFNSDKSFKYQSINLNTLINSSILITSLVKETIYILNKSPKSWLFLDRNEIRNLTMHKTNYISSRYISLIKKYEILVFTDYSASDLIDHEIDMMDINILKEFAPFLKHVGNFVFNDFKEIIKCIDYKDINIQQSVKTLNSITNSRTYIFHEGNNYTSFSFVKFELSFFYLLLDLEMCQELDLSINYLSNKFGIKLNINSIEQVLFDCLLLDRYPKLFIDSKQIKDEELLQNIKTAIQKKTKGYAKFKSNILKSVKCENYYRQVDGRYVKVSNISNLIYVYISNCKLSIINKAMVLLIDENLEDLKITIDYDNYKIVSYTDSYNNLVVQKINTAFLHFLKPEQREFKNLPSINKESIDVNKLD